MQHGLFPEETFAATVLALGVEPSGLDDARTDEIAHDGTALAERTPSCSEV